jgi:hypothetical protein
VPLARKLGLSSDFNVLCRDKRIGESLHTPPRCLADPHMLNFCAVQKRGGRRIAMRWGAGAASASAGREAARDRNLKKILPNK